MVTRYNPLIVKNVAAVISLISTVTLKYKYASFFCGLFVCIFLFKDMIAGVFQPLIVSFAKQR